MICLDILLLFDSVDDVKPAEGVVSAMLTDIVRENVGDSGDAGLGHWMRASQWRGFRRTALWSSMRQITVSGRGTGGGLSMGVDLFVMFIYEPNEVFFTESRPTDMGGKRPE